MGSVAPWAFEVGFKDFLLDIPGQATWLQRWFTDIGLLHQGLQAKFPELTSLKMGMH